MFLILRATEALVIDPHQNEEALALLDAHQIQHVTILLSHEHFDHTSGVNWLRAHYPCKVITNRKCAEVVAVRRNNNPMLVALVLAENDKADGGNRYAEFKKTFQPYTVETDEVYDPPCEFKAAGLSFNAVQTPGHSPGSWCLTVEDTLVITGDTLIKDTAVVDRFPESSVEDYRKITLPFLRSLDPELWVLPGHFDPFKMKDNNILHTYDV
jgi:glyoxylase-like metal-dependent hydrolase (beta-lactamase superfamily II)